MNENKRINKTQIKFKKFFCFFDFFNNVTPNTKFNNKYIIKIILKYFVGNTFKNNTIDIVIVDNKKNNKYINLLLLVDFFFFFGIIHNTSYSITIGYKKLFFT